ncbi:endosomal/vacuolar adapter protein Ypt35p [Diutina catenulata]
MAAAKPEELEPVAPKPIELSGDDPEGKYCHITNVLVGEHHEIEGDIGKPYTVWQIKITLGESDYSSIILYKRYSEIEHFREQLAADVHDRTLPQLPSKDNFNVDRLMMTQTWLEKRRRGLQWFLSNVLLNPRYQRSPVVTAFVLNKDK